MFLQVATLTAVYLVRPDQWDPAIAVDLLNALADKGVTVSRNAAGTWVVPENPFVEPLSVELGVVVEKTTEPQKDVTPVKQRLHADGSLHGNGHIVTLDHRENAAFVATGFLLDRFEGVSWSADGTVILDSWYADGFARVNNFSKQFAVKLTLTDNPSVKPAWALARPRAGLIGEAPWLEPMLEENAIPFTKVSGMQSGFHSMLLIGAPASLEPYREFMAGGGTLIVIPKSIGPAASISIQPDPVSFGMPPSLRVFATTEGMPAAGRMIAKFADGSAALAEEPVGKGRLLVFHFRPQIGSAKLLFNAIYLASARKL
jgi:hypothetical protein